MSELTQPNERIIDLLNKADELKKVLHQHLGDIHYQMGDDYISDSAWLELKDQYDYCSAVYNGCMKIAEFYGDG